MKINYFDIFILLLSVCTCFGNIGGAFQVERILALILSPWFFSNLRNSFYLKPIVKTLLLFYVYMAVSFLWTPDKQEAIKELVYYPIHFILFLEIIVFARRATMPLKCLSRGWMISVFVCSLVAYWEITTGQHLSLAKEQSDTFNTGTFILQRMTASVTFNNYNSYVTFLCFSFPWIFYIVLDRGRKLMEQMFAFSSLIMASLVIIINASRGGVLAVIIMLFIYYLYSEKSRFKNMVLIFAIILIGYVLVQFGDSITAVITVRAADGGIFEDQARSIIWANALEAFADSWGFGVGIGGLSAAMEKYADGGITITHNFFF